jgi:hypothetical protein
MGKPTLKQQRSSAMGAARSEMRRKGINPDIASAVDAYLVLDDLCRTELGLEGCQWYVKNAENRSQDSLFRKEWQDRQKHTAGKGFEHLQQEGAAEFGRDWLAINTHIRDTALYYGANLEDPSTKTMLTAIALKVLRVSKERWQALAKLSKRASWTCDAFLQANTGRAVENLGTRGEILKDAIGELRHEVESVSPPAL